MIVDCISDLHGDYPELQGGDLLIVAGDLTAADRELQHAEFSCWLKKQPYTKKILIAGNHDGLVQQEVCFYGGPESSIEYLEDSGTEFEGFKIWGSPWTPTFLNWHFMKDRGDEIKAMWDLIPDDTEILITHGPAFGIQDQCGNKLLGCEELRDAINHRLHKLKLHVFGHIHSGYGMVKVNGVIHVNASLMNEDYDFVNKPIRIEL